MRGGRSEGLRRREGCVREASGWRHEGLCEGGREKKKLS